MASDYQYLTTAEYASYDLSVSGVTNESLAEQHISYAEKVIDAYCGAWPRFYCEQTGEVDDVDDTTVYSSTFGDYNLNYWAAGGLYLCVYDGGGVGEERLITASDEEEVTLASAISGLVAGSKFALRQYSVFPRSKDVDGTQVPFIPRQVKMAVAAQVAFATQKGSEGAGLWHADPVLNDRADITSENFGSGYSYSRDARKVVGPDQFIAPQAVLHLRGFKWRVGKMRRRGVVQEWGGFY